MSDLSHQSAFRLIYKRHRTKAEEEALQSHLQTCPDCRQDAQMAGLFGNHLVLKSLPTRPPPQFSAIYREQAARRSRRSHIMKPIYAVGGAVALALLMLAGWFIIRSNIQTTGLVDAPDLPAISISETQAEMDNQLLEAIRGKDIAAVERLLEVGASADAVDAEGNPALYYAIIAIETGGSSDMVAMLLNNGANPDVLDSFGKTPLAVAAKNGRLEAVQLLLDAGADVNTEFAIGSDDDKSPLIEAVRAGHIEIVELLIARGADVEQQESNDQSRPLHYAAANDNPAIIRILLEKGAELNAENIWQWTPLFNAVRYSPAETAQLLINAGAEVNALSAAGRTPMMVLIEQGRLGGMTEKLMLLLDNGADPNLQDDNGDTALHFAASTGKIDAIPILIEGGADVDLRNNEGQAPLDVATGDSQELLQEAGASAAVSNLDKQLFAAVDTGDTLEVERLLKAGANPNVANGEGNMPLALAAAVRNLEIAQLLLDAGADVNSTASKMYPAGQNLIEAPAIAHAAYQRQIEMVALLIENGADVNRPQATSAETALHNAAFRSSPEIVKLLLDNGADPDLPASSSWFPEGSTALLYAIGNGSVSSAEALLEGGADANAIVGQGQTPLMFTFQQQFSTSQVTNFVTALLKGRADPNVQDPNGDAALHYAIKFNQTDLVPLLIEHGAAIDQQNGEGNTALHLAARTNKAEVVTILLELGASANLENNEGQTALDVATGESLELLREAGAQ